MTDWAALDHAYGAADDVPALLAAAEQSGAESGAAWDEAWSRLCHQGTVYTASYAALPLLADMAIRHAPAGYVAALDLAAGIVASTDGPVDAAVVRQQYSTTVSRLRDLAEANLALAVDDLEFVYALQALMAFEDGGIWQRELTNLADGEVEVDCPSCGESLLLTLEIPQFGISSEQSAPYALVPSLAATEESVHGRRMLALAQQHGRPQVAAHIPYLFGRTTCSRCDKNFEVSEALA